MTEEAGRRRRRAGWLEDLLEHRLIRTLVAGLIVVSLLPLEGLEGRLRPFFLGAFGLEVVLRFVVLARGRLRRGAPSRRVELLFVLFDLLAWLSFLPLDQLLGVDAVWLRGLRLVRLLVLLRFSREVARDVWRVLTRREQLQQIGLVTTAVVALSFVAAVLLAQLRVPHDYDGTEGPPEDFWDQIWWSFRQVESPDNLVGNLDAHPIVLLISLGLTITGIFVFSYLIGVGTNVVEQVLRAERRRPVPYRDHTLVVGPMHESELLVREYVRIYDKNRALRRPSLRELWRWLTSRAPAGMLSRAWRSSAPTRNPPATSTSPRCAGSSTARATPPSPSRSTAPPPIRPSGRSSSRPGAARPRTPTPSRSPASPRSAP